MVELWTELSAARELIRACVAKRVDGADATELISTAKLFCGRVSRRVADECIQLHGGWGYMKESMAGRALGLRV
jgi:citronellyl-CoA dehydrogenase